MFSEQIAIAIRTRLIEMGTDKKGRWTQTRLARESGVDKGALNRFLTNRGGLTNQNLTAIARVLDIELRHQGEDVDVIINPKSSAENEVN